MWHRRLDLWLKFFFFCLILGVAVHFRTHWLSIAPEGIWFDEAQNVLVAQRILNDPSYRPVFIGELTQLPAIFFYWFALFVKMLGPTVLAVRIPMTIVGIGAVIGMFFLGKELFNWRIGLIAMFFLAVMRWHVNFSRFGLHSGFSPFFLVMMFFCIRNALRTGNFSAFIGAGLCMGLGLQGYYSFLFAPILLVVYLIHYLAWSGTVYIRRFIAGMALFALSAIAVYAPVAVFAVQHGVTFSQRLSTVLGVHTTDIAVVYPAIKKTTIEHLKMFTVRGDNNGRHNIPGAPMLDKWTGYLFLSGAAIAALNFYKPQYFLLLAWVALFLQGGIWSVSFESPQAHRVFAVTPAIALLAALPFGTVWTWLATRRRKRPFLQFLLIILLCVICHSIALTNWNDYFHNQLQRSDVQQAYSLEETWAGEIIRDSPENDRILLSTYLLGMPTVTLLSQGRHNVDRFRPMTDLPLRSPEPTVIILSWEESFTYDLLRMYYPHAEFRALAAEGSMPILYQAVIRPKDIEDTKGLVRHIDADKDTVWSGFLNVPDHTSLTIASTTDTPTYIQFNDAVVTQLRGTDPHIIEGPSGLAAVTIAVRSADTGDLPPLLWSINGRPMKPINRDDYFRSPVEQVGLQADYYRPINGKMEKVGSRIDPSPGGHIHIPPMPVPYRIVWHGFLSIKESGNYSFALHAIDAAELYLDDVPIIHSERNTMISAPIPLAKGKRKIKIVFNQNGGSPHLCDILIKSEKTNLGRISPLDFSMH